MIPQVGLSQKIGLNLYWIRAAAALCENGHLDCNKGVLMGYDEKREEFGVWYYDSSRMLYTEGQYFRAAEETSDTPIHDARQKALQQFNLRCIARM